MIRNISLSIKLRGQPISLPTSGTFALAHDDGFWLHGLKQALLASLPARF
jgi:hypothetical protein